MPRLFTGIEIPAEIATELALLRGGLAGARWIEPENYHVTLRFIGDIGVDLANEIAHELESIRPRPVTVVLERLGAFGGDRPRALVARIAVDEGLVGLQADQERMMRRLGAPGDSRKFTPHVTLARLRGATAEAVGFYIETRGDLRPMSFQAERFVLYSSRASTGGGPYQIEVAYPL